MSRPTSRSADAAQSSSTEMSKVAQQSLAVFRRVEREEAKILKLVAAEEKLIKERLEYRYRNLNDTSRLEEHRSRHLELNTEAREMLVLEVDDSMAKKQQTVAKKQYAARQLELNLPAWFKTVTETISVARSCGHSNKLKWRSKCLALLKRCILESEDDPNGVESRIRLRRIVLEINNNPANELVRQLEALKGDFIHDMVTSDSKLGQDSVLFHAAKALLDEGDSDSASCKVPLSRSGWSTRLDEANMSAKSAAQSSMSFSTLSRPLTLSESVISAAFEPGTGSKLLPPLMGVGSESMCAESQGSPSALSPGFEGFPAGGASSPTDMDLTGKQQVPNPLRGIPTLATRGAIKGNVHPPCDHQEQAQAVMRMRATARTGNYALCRSIFVHNFDPPEAVRQGKISVGRLAPTLQPFLSLMVAFKNAQELRFQDAFEVMDLIESYGLKPDVTIYNVLMRACERESRWRRALAIYRDMMEIHKVMPNVQTFDVIIDCCRHSLEQPATIFDELRRHKLPRDYCYKASLCNCGNRLPQQTLYEAMYDISLAELPPNIKKFDTRGDGQGNREEGLVYPADALTETVKEYQWRKLKNVMKTSLPGTSPVRNAEPSDPQRAFNVQIARSLPFEPSELAFRSSIASGSFLGDTARNGSVGSVPETLGAARFIGDTPAMATYKNKLSQLDQASWVSDVPYYDQTLDNMLSPSIAAVQEKSPSRLGSPTNTPAATPAGKGGKKHLSTLAVAFEKVLAEEAEEALVASMPSVASTTDEYSKRVGTRASRRTPTAGSQNKTDKFSHRTHQTWQKPLAKLPRADLVMRNVERSITLGDPVVLPSKAQHHATTVLLKHG